MGASVVEAQPGRGFGRGPGGRGFGGSDANLQLLFDEEVRKELEIVDSQVEKLRELSNKVRGESQERMREMFSGFRDLSEEERREKFGEIREKMQKYAQEVEKQIGEVLLPHQMDRLKQIALQSRLRRSGTAR